jgi:hypothetical protein
MVRADGGSGAAEPGQVGGAEEGQAGRLSHPSAIVISTMDADAAAEAAAATAAWEEMEGLGAGQQPKVARQQLLDLYWSLRQ